jgi:WD40 repeat protein
MMALGAPGTQDEDEDNLLPLSADFDLQVVRGSDIKVKHRATLGGLDCQSFCVRYDPFDKYIAQGCHDGSIRIWNVFTGNCSFQLNTGMENPKPTCMVRWRPAKSRAITKNVLISVNANGAL